VKDAIDFFVKKLSGDQIDISDLDTLLGHISVIQNRVIRFEYFFVGGD